MDDNVLSTLERIQQAALEEFSDKGFLGASETLQEHLLCKKRYPFHGSVLSRL